jgi:hypothetical protein
MARLREAFEASEDVDFAGKFTVKEPNVSHQNRAKAVASEIWKATGYRFT